MKWTAAEKEQQRQAGAEILKRIYAAAKDHAGAINIPQGIYRFRETREPWQPAHIALHSVTNCTIEGNGSWFYFERQATAFLLGGCDQVTIQNINIDYDPLPYAQGTVVSINEQPPRSIVFQLDEGYEMPEKMRQNKFEWTTGISSNDNRRFMIFDKETKLFKTDQLGMDKNNPQPLKKLANGNYGVPIWVWNGYSLQEAGVTVGTPIVIFNRSPRTIRLEGCGKVVLDNVDVYTGGFGYVGAYGAGPLIFRNCDIKRRPGTSRLMACVCDGFNVRGTSQGATIENCSVEAIGDDCVNLQGAYCRFFQQVSPTELIVAPTSGSEGANPVWHFLAGTPWRDPARPKNQNMKSWEYLGKRKILSKTQLKYTIPIGQKIPKWAANANYTPGQEYPALQVVLDTPLTVDANTIFWSEGSIVRGSVIRNNVFANNWGTGIRLQTMDAVVENNKISYTALRALAIGGLPGYWGEAANSQNVVIRNNVFADSGRVRGNAAVEMKVEGDPEKTEPISNILFENNRIIHPRGSGIELSGCDHITITNNIIAGLHSRSPNTKADDPSVLIDDRKYGQPIVCGDGLKNVTIKNNQVGW